MNKSKRNLIKKAQDIPLIELGERDRWICHICRKEIKKIEEASRDHVIPLWNGGTSDMKNLKIAHKLCNEAKDKYP